MLIHILQNIALLSLSATGIFAIEDMGWLRQRARLRRLAIGVFLGVITALVANINLTNAGGVPIDSRAGPLLVAGALGGPLAGLAAAAVGGAARVAAGGDTVWLGVTGYLMYGIIGAAVHLAAPRAVRDRLTARRVTLLAALSCAGATLLSLAAVPRPDLGPWLSGVLPPILFANVLSTGLTGAVVAAALRAAAVSRDNEKLRERLQLATSSAGIGVWDYDAVTGEMTWDDTQYAIYGLDRGNFGGTFPDWIARIHPDDRPRVLDEISRARAGDMPYDTEFRIVTPGGRTRYIKANAAQVRDPSGRLLRSVGTNLDVTALRESQAQRIAAERELLALGRTAPGVILRYRLAESGHARIETTGAGGSEIPGLAPERLKGDASLFWSLVPESARDAARASLEAALRAGRPWAHSFQLSTAPTGEQPRLRWVQARGNPTSQPGAEASMTLLLIDITSQRETEAELAESRELFHQSQKQEAIGQLSGGIAHDFNNLLAVILGNLEMVLDGTIGARERAYLEDARDQVRKGGRLTQQLLSFTRRAALQPEVVDVAEVLDGMGRLLERTLPAHIEVAIEVAPGTRHVRLDRSGLENALLNIALNARDAMPEGGRLSIAAENVRLAPDAANVNAAARRGGEHVRLALTDTGEGMPAEVAERAFGPYFTTKAPGGGSGLGLSMVEGFVRQSGGLVRLESEPGNGTRVEMLFPATDAPVTEHAPEPPDRPETMPGGGERLLLAEDDDGLRTLLTRQLTALGYRVTATSCGAEALERFTADPEFDLLVTDIVMPGDPQGPALAAEVRARHPGLPVIFMTGYAGDQVVNGEGLPADAPCLQKPMRIATLSRAIRDALHQERQGP